MHAGMCVCIVDSLGGVKGKGKRGTRGGRETGQVVHRQYPHSHYVSV